MILKPWFDVVLKIYASRFKACCSENPTACIHSWVGAQKNLQHDLKVKSNINYFIIVVLCILSEDLIYAF